MSNKIDVLKTCKRPLALFIAAGVLTSGATLWAPVASADITFEDKGTRFSVEVSDEPIAEVMDELSERFDFSVDGYPSNWSKEPMNFHATGNLERVLRALLKDTSHVFEYRTDLETKVTRITAIKLLNEGEAGFVAAPLRTSPSNGVSQNNNSQNPGAINRSRAPSGAINRRSSNGGQSRLNEPDLPIDAANRSGSNASVSANTPGSGLSQSLEARARQANPTDNSASQATSPAAVNPDMQALTQKAMQDVQGLAEALRKAEN